jgi:hypothetical protein
VAAAAVVELEIQPALERAVHHQVDLIVVGPVLVAAR